MLRKLLFCVLIFKLISASNPFTTTTELFATVDPAIHNVLLAAFLPEDYELPVNIYEWNVEDIVYYINQSDPDFLYTIDTATMIQIFPDYVLKQLPREVLVYHELYYLLPPEDTSFCANCTRNITEE